MCFMLHVFAVICVTFVVFAISKLAKRPVFCVSAYTSISGPPIPLNTDA